MDFSSFKAGKVLPDPEQPLAAGSPQGEPQREAACRSFVPRLPCKHLMKRPQRQPAAERRISLAMA